MAVAVTQLSPNADFVAGNKRVKIRDVAFSGTYPTGGEVIDADDVGLKVIDFAIVDGAASETDETGAWITNVDYTTTGVKLVLFESAGAGLVHTQKPNEAYESAGRVRVTFVGH